MRLKKIIACFLAASLLVGCSHKTEKKVVRTPKKVSVKPTPRFYLPATEENIYYLAKGIYADSGWQKEDFFLEVAGVNIIKKVKLGQAKSIRDAVGEVDVEPDERCLEIAENLIRFDVQNSFPDDLGEWRVTKGYT